MIDMAEVGTLRFNLGSVAIGFVPATHHATAEKYTQ